MGRSIRSVPFFLPTHCARLYTRKVMLCSMNTNIEHGFNPEEEAENSFEVDKEFLSTGFSQEIQKAERKEQEGKEEHWGRTTFVAAKMAELESPATVPEEVKQKLEEGLQHKRDNNDAWGTAFTARYLTLIDPEKYAEHPFDFSEQENQRFLEELNERKKRAERKEEKWTDFFAMLDHVREVSPKVFESIAIDEDTEKGLEKCLEKLEQEDPALFVHTALAVEECAEGRLAKIDFSDTRVKKVIRSAILEAREAKEKGDVWRYSFIMSQAKLLHRKI